MGIIKINKIRIYAHHGCMPEETKIGTYFEVNVEIETDFNLAALNDDLNQTVDYVTVREIVSREMKIPSKLIEHAGKRIKDSLLSEIPQIQNAVISVTKFSAPMGGEVESVTVIL